MARTRTVTWLYRCDATTADGLPACIDSDYQVSSGDHVETGRGTVVYDQLDADAAARSLGWKLGKFVLCPSCAKGGAS